VFYWSANFEKFDNVVTKQVNFLQLISVNILKSCRSIGKQCVYVHTFFWYSSLLLYNFFNIIMSWNLLSALKSLCYTAFSSYIYKNNSILQLVLLWNTYTASFVYLMSEWRLFFWSWMLPLFVRLDVRASNIIGTWASQQICWSFS